jgi:hypothetical protein
VLADAGYRGLSAQTAPAVLTPRPVRRKNQIPVPPALTAAHEAERRAHAAQRIREEHGISHLKSWRPCRVTSADASMSTPSCARAGLVSSQNKPHDLPNFTAHGELSRPAPPVIAPALNRSTIARR